MGFERTIIKFLQLNATTGWISFFQAVTLLGSYLGFAVCFLILFPRSKGLLISMTMTFVLGSLFNHLLKSIIARPRPFESYEDIKNYGDESGYSMPSGHSLCAAIFATHLIVYVHLLTKNKWTRVLATISISLLAGLVAFSRMVLGVHYLTDTLVGMGMGVLISSVAIIATTVAIHGLARRYYDKN